MLVKHKSNTTPACTGKCAASFQTVSPGRAVTVGALMLMLMLMARGRKMHSFLWAVSVVRQVGLFLLLFSILGFAVQAGTHAQTNTHTRARARIRTHTHTHTH